MTKVRDLVSYRIVEGQMTDWAFKDLLLALSDKNIPEALVLPSYLRRAKQLCAEKPIKIGCGIDYPLACGTLAKVSFEIGQAFQDGADFLEIWLNQRLFLEGMSEFETFFDTLHSFSLQGVEIRIAVNTDDMKELTKILVAQRLRQFAWRNLTLGRNPSIEAALHDLALFSLDGGPQLEIQCNLSQASNEAIALLYGKGAKKFGLFSLTELDLDVTL